MNRQIAEKVLLTAVMIAWLVWMPMVGYENYSIHPVSSHLLYMWSHANVWHLAGNLFALWIWRGELSVLPSVLMAFLCSFIPAFGFWPIGMTVGFSGVLFAMAGIRWGNYCRRMPFKSIAYSDFFFKAMPFALVGIVIPHINWCIHLYCMLAGFAYGRFHR